MDSSVSKFLVPEHSLLGLIGSTAVNCWGEVFQIYRAFGSGNIESGDFVGIYYPRVSRWFSLRKNQAHTEQCPGKPNTATGV